VQFSWLGALLISRCGIFVCKLASYTVGFDALFVRVDHRKLLAFIILYMKFLCLQNNYILAIHLHQI